MAVPVEHSLPPHLLAHRVARPARPRRAVRSAQHHLRLESRGLVVLIQPEPLMGRRLPRVSARPPASVSPTSCTSLLPRALERHPLHDVEGEAHLR